MKFKGKVDHWAHLMMLILLLECGLMLYLAWFSQSLFYGVIGTLVGLFLLFFTPMYLRTEYILEERELVIRSGIFFTWHIPYPVIIQAVKTDDMTASIGFSLQRLDFQWWEHDKRKRLLIAPEDRERFQRMLLIKNPMIRIDDNQTRAGDHWTDALSSAGKKLTQKPATEQDVSSDWKNE
ncbi:MAG: PH domain-containing protein [Massiliimalia sp.]|jgi:hypothetical protein